MKKTIGITPIILAVVTLMIPVNGQAQKVIVHEIHDGTVIYAHENTLVVELPDGSAQVIDVEPDFTFDLDGKKVPASELVPGTKLKANVTITQTPRVVEVTEVKSGTILSIVGQNITIRTPDGTKMFKNIPSDFRFNVRGKHVLINQLTEGMKVTALVVVEEVEIETEEEVKVKAKAPKN